MGRRVVRADALPDDPAELGRVYTGWFEQDELERLWARLSPSLRQAFGDLAGLRSFREQVRVGAGDERAVADERVTPWLGMRVYSRTASFTRAQRPVLVQWMLDRDGLAAGFLVEPGQLPAPSRYLDHRTRTRLRLPFDGEWFVFWGGRHPVENRHAHAPDQRFALDFLIVRDGRTHAGGPPTRNEQFHCYDLPVLATGDGLVVAAEDAIPDNVPGIQNTLAPLGNHLVLDHGRGEVSFLAHLRAGSVRVRPGDGVRAGDPVARCGNSGRSSEPHLHYHLQNSAVYGAGEGIPAQFLDYLADGRPVARGEPTRGQSVRPAPPESRE